VVGAPAVLVLTSEDLLGARLFSLPVAGTFRRLLDGLLPEAIFCSASMLLLPRPGLDGEGEGGEAAGVTLTNSSVEPDATDFATLVLLFFFPNSPRSGISQR
jgi:hypothetical protein